MSELLKPKGRGRGRGTAATPATPAAGPAGRRLGTVNPTEPTASSSTSMMGGSEYAKKATIPGEPIKTKTKFVPNMKRKVKVSNSDDEDVKVVETELPGRGRGRGRGALPRARVELEMTASGPMAQGPGGIPKNFGARAQPMGGGAGVMNRSNTGSTAGGPAGQFADVDDSDLDAGSDEDFTIRAKDLGTIGMEDEMAPITLPKDPGVERLALERKAERTERRLKAETDGLVKMEDDMSSIYASNTATPAPGFESESKADSNDLKDFKNLSGLDDDQKKAKLQLLLSGGGPEMDLTADFDVENPEKEQLYMFQFPRKFPELVSAMEAMAIKHPETVVKPEGEEEEEVEKKKKKTPPVWGTAGSRNAKAARWSLEQGQIGELLVRKSGRVTILINGDLEFEVLPAAQPSFLQEIVILDHDESTVPRPSSSKIKNPIESEPNRSILTMGQTSKKFIVVPDVQNLLNGIAKQEEEEKLVKRNKKKMKEENA